MRGPFSLRKSCMQFIAVSALGWDSGVLGLGRDHSGGRGRRERGTGTGRGGQGPPDVSLASCFVACVPRLAILRGCGNHCTALAPLAWHLADGAE